ncbi:MAG: peptide chain release factor N(5)-glutamine methyltransferase [Actinobacteria bacterium]|nr:peptide chain release factor N(5)-glutamine methyltransferase [Actinomycetota bacterium]
MRPPEVLRRASAYLARHDVESPLPTAEALLTSVLGVDRAGLYTRGQDLTPGEARAFGRALCLRCAGTPVQHMTGEQAFRRLTLVVRPGVFVPRPETEMLVEIALAELGEAPIVVDVGTGSGAIALAVKDERPGATVFATDLSREAVELARWNASRLGLEVDVREGDLLFPLATELRGRVDLVVSNPPYVGADAYGALPPEVRADPVAALVGGPALYERLMTEASSWLRPGGVLAVEVGADDGETIAEIFRPSFDGVRIEPDLAGRDRVVVGRRR